MGGRVPEIGAHSMIDKPDSVSRVIAPITAMARIMAAQTSSHSPTARSDLTRLLGAAAVVIVVMGGRISGALSRFGDPSRIVPRRKLREF